MVATVVPFMERGTILAEETISGFLDLQRLGRRLKSARADMGFISTRDVASVVARKYPAAGISSVSLGRYERGEYEPPLRVLVALSLVYDKPIAYFMEVAVTGDAARDYDRLNG